MTNLEAFRALADAAPADGMVMVPVTWCREALGSSPSVPVADDKADRLLTAEQVAARLEWSERSVYRAAKAWPFARKLGKSLRFSERGLERWLASRRAA